MKHRIVTAAQMKAIEQAGNAHSLPYLQMMENAGLAAYAELKNVPSVQAWISRSGYLRGGDLLFYQSFVVHRPCRLQ